jgi:tRNA1Val (adenine37-N6)-methyltransferase
MFRFKQFSVDQSGCAMKINTDGVLLGAITEADDPKTILDIGTGTGVIALMLAQRFTNAKIDAVEIDPIAAQTAGRNFEASPFADRLTVHPSGFESYLAGFPGKKYDLIISNPPFYIDSLKSPGAKKTLAKHTDIDFFENLVNTVSNHLAPNGCCWLILPVNIAEIVIELMIGHRLHLQGRIDVQSYLHSEVHRSIICFGFDKVSVQISKLTIYKDINVYADEYQQLLQPYFLAF